MADDLIINDQTPEHMLYWDDRLTGLILPAGRGSGYAYGGVAEPFPDSLLIPRSDWQAMIEELTQRASLLSLMCDELNVVVEDQSRTNYCWCNAPTHCMKIIRAIQGEPLIDLSAASVGAQITGYRNVGGWGKTALEFIASKGVVPTSLWPKNQIDRRYATPEALAAAQAYRFTEWWELEPNNLDQLASCLIRGFPVSVGLDWWSHQVTYVDPLWLDGEFAVRFDNSWGQGYGTNGRGVIQGRRILPSDATTPRVALAA